MICCRKNSYNIDDCRSARTISKRYRGSDIADQEKFWYQTVMNNTDLVAGNQKWLFKQKKLLCLLCLHIQVNLPTGLDKHIFCFKQKEFL